MPSRGWLLKGGREGRGPCSEAKGAKREEELSPLRGTEAALRADGGSGRAGGGSRGGGGVGRQRDTHHLSFRRLLPPSLIASALSARAHSPSRQAKIEQDKEKPHGKPEVRKKEKLHGKSEKRKKEKRRKRNTGRVAPGSVFLPQLLSPRRPPCDSTPRTGASGSAKSRPFLPIGRPGIT